MAEECLGVIPPVWVCVFHSGGLRHHMEQEHRLNECLLNLPLAAWGSQPAGAHATGSQALGKLPTILSP